jgi:pimeloyl-ACP methyl ester carboxylesterase
MSSTDAMAQIEPTAKDATVFSYKIHYLEAGRGAPVILLHGMGGEGARWMPTIRGLAPEFRVIAPDQIGWGKSDKPMTVYHRQRGDGDGQQATENDGRTRPTLVFRPFLSPTVATPG